MANLETLEKQINQLRERNVKVENDKAWETSKTRRALLVIFTYLAIGFYFQAINIEKPWHNAIVPAVAFLLSTLTLPFFKDLWSKHLHKK